MEAPQRHSDAESTSSSSSSSSSSSEESTSKKRKRKEKKEKKEKKKEKKEKKKHKREKKSKREKKEKKEKKRDKKHKTEQKAAAAVVDQSNFGKYGIVREEHMHAKQREFEAWAVEVKGVMGFSNMPRRELMLLFRSFMEDFNTATMPHQKYYNHEKWEMSEYHQAQLNKQQGLLADGSVRSEFNDEAELSAARRRERASREAAQFAALKDTMSQRQSQIEDMRRQETLRGEQQLAFRFGDLKEVERLGRKLAPEETAPGGGAKHPWAR